MNAAERDAGLVRGLGTWGLAAAIVGMIVGAGIFAVPGALAAAVGPYAPLAFLACAIAIGAIAICFAEGGSRIPTSGGASATRVGWRTSKHCTLYRNGVVEESR